jgi:phosphoserine phosphatase RsbU/P
LFFGLINGARNELVYCNAGHYPPLLCRTNGTVERLAAGGMVMGVIPDVTYEEVAITVGAGDVLLLYTDGVTEMVNKSDEELGEDRLAAVLRKYRGDSASAIVEGVEKALAEWREDVQQWDDVTIFVTKITA